MAERIQRYADLAAAIRRAPARLGAVRLVAVDGPAGSGKTTFAGRLAAAVRVGGAGAYVLHTDDILDGWADLHAFWPRLDRWVLAPLRRGEPGCFRRYDWHRGAFDDRWHPVAVPDVLVVEGVGTARTAVTPELSLSVFVVADRPLRLARGLARDGEELRTQWLRWMAEEDVHFAADATRARADVVVAGAPTVAHDPELEYVQLDPAACGHGEIG